MEEEKLLVDRETVNKLWVKSQQRDKKNIAFSCGVGVGISYTLRELGLSWEAKT